ncbi:MAG: hypothetical protein ACLFVJ_16480 [Persicimonas sp.]
MADENSRRDFLRWVGASSGALVLGGLGCGSTAGAVDGTDARRDADSSRDGGADSSADGGSDAGVDARDAEDPVCEPTGSDVEGPFHEPGAPERTVLADADEAGERLVIEGTVYGPDCTTPVDGALLDVWHADADGNYHDAEADYRLRGQMMSDTDGTYRFETIRPGHYPLGNSMRPAHIHFTITKPGYAPLTTQLYFAGDPYLSPNDPCGNGCNSGDPTLIIDLEDGPGDIDARGTFDIVLEGT